MRVWTGEEQEPKEELLKIKKGQEFLKRVNKNGAWAHEQRSTHWNREVFLKMAPSRNNLGKGTGSQFRNRVSVIAHWLRKRT